MSTEDTNKWIICRICLKSNGKKLSPLFGTDAAVERFKEKIEECGGITLSENGNFPNKICAKCLLLFRAAHKFRTLCQRSQQQLLEFLQEESASSASAPVVSRRKSDQETSVTIFAVCPRVAEESQKSIILIKQDDADDSQAVEDDGQCEEFQEFTLPEGQQSEDNDIGATSAEYIDISTERLEFLEDDSNQDNAYKFTYCSSTFEVLKENENSRESTTEVEKFSYEVEMDEAPPDAEEDTILVYEVKHDSSADLDTDNTAKTKLSQKRKRRTKTKSGKSNLKLERKEEEEEEDMGKLKAATYVCSFCGNMYSEKAKLTLHMKIHTKVKPHECEICHKRFAQTPQLARHMNSHTGSRPFKCKFCNSRFADPSTCIKHERIHTNERPYPCHICGKAFSYSNVLKVHIMTHTGEKPFQCEYCGKKFVQLHHKRTHERTHNAENKLLKLSDDSMDNLQ